MLGKLITLVVTQPNCTLDVRDKDIQIDIYGGETQPATEIGFKNDCFGVFVGEFFYPFNNVFDELTYTEKMDIYRKLVF